MLSVGAALLDLVLPGDCAGCGRPGSLCCPACRQSLNRPVGLVWPQPSPIGLPPPWSALAYDEPVRSLLLAYKERGAIGLAPTLAQPLATAIVAAGRAAGDSGAPVALVPIPSTRKAIRDRGDDVVHVLTRRAAVIARRSGARVQVVCVLRHGRVVADSAGLSSVDRAANLTGAFTLNGAARVRGRRTLVVDDLITTGATIAEAARVLRAHGAMVGGAAVVAATQRRRRPGR